MDDYQFTMADNKAYKYPRVVGDIGASSLPHSIATTASGSLSNLLKSFGFNSSYQPMSSATEHYDLVLQGEQSVRQGSGLGSGTITPLLAWRLDMYQGQTSHPTLGSPLSASQPYNPQGQNSQGAQTYNNATLGWGDVRDVAKAYIIAFEVPTASERYCLVEKVAHYSEVVEILRKLYPEIQPPEKCADDKMFVPTYKVSKKSLGIDFMPVEVSFKDTVESLKEKKFVDKSSI